MRLVPSCRRCTHCTARACTPSLPQDLLQAPHSSATQLPRGTEMGRGVRGDAHAWEAAGALPTLPHRYLYTCIIGDESISCRVGGGLTLVGSTPGGYSAAGSALASCRCRRSFYAPSGCHFSAGSHTWCTGCLEGDAEYGCRGPTRSSPHPSPASLPGRVRSDVTAQVGPKQCFILACRGCLCECQTHPHQPPGVTQPAMGCTHREGTKQTQPSPHPFPMLLSQKPRSRHRRFLGETPP